MIVYVLCCVKLNVGSHVLFTDSLILSAGLVRSETNAGFSNSRQHRSGYRVLQLAQYLATCMQTDVIHDNRRKHNYVVLLSFIFNLSVEWFSEFS